MSESRASQAIYFVNGETPSSTTFFNDRGFEYGDGIFETMLFESSKFPFLSFHKARLIKSTERLDIPFCEDNFDRTISRLSSEAPWTNARVRISITRAYSGDGSYPGTSDDSQLYAVMKPLQPISKVHRLISSPYPLPAFARLSGIKHLNRLPYILGAQKCLRDLDGSEAQVAFFNERDEIIESMHHNIFFVKDSDVYTPLIEECGVLGVMRTVLIDCLAKQMKLKVIEKNISRAEIDTFEECFISNAVKGFESVTHLDGVQFQSFECCSKLNTALTKFKKTL